MNNKKAPGREERPALGHTKHNRCMVTPVQDLVVWTSGSIPRSGTDPFVSGKVCGIDEWRAGRLPPLLRETARKCGRSLCLQASPMIPPSIKEKPHPAT